MPVLDLAREIRQLAVDPGAGEPRGNVDGLGNGNGRQGPRPPAGNGASNGPPAGQRHANDPNSVRILLFQALRKMQAWANAPEAVVAATTATAAPTPSTVQVVQDVFLVASTLTTVVPAAAATEGASLDVFVRQPLTGTPGSVAFNSGFRLTPSNIAQTLGSWSVFSFVGKADGKWWLRTNIRTGVFYS